MFGWNWNQRREGVDQLLRLNCDEGGGVPENQSKTIVWGALERCYDSFDGFTKGLPKNLNSLKTHGIWQPVFSSICPGTT